MSNKNSTLSLNIPFWIAVAVLVVSGFHILALPTWLVVIAWIVVIGILGTFLAILTFFLIMLARGKAHWTWGNKR